VTAVVEPTWEETEFGGLALERDRFGRPLVIPPEGGRPVPYTRVTTLVGALEDTYNLGRWQQRMVAHGLSVRADLLLRVNSLGPEPAKFLQDPRGQWVANPRHQAWKQDMDEACEAASEAAAAHAKATVGTSLHALAERMDRSEDVGVVPQDYLPHLAAYAEATDGWEHLQIERFMVNDELKTGGTPDRVVRVPGYDRPMIADLKTGDVTYGVGKMAMQLAVYSRSEIYELSGQRRPLPADLDLDTGLIIALDSTRATCEVFEIDLHAGWQAVLLAVQVRRWRSKRGLMTPYRAPTTRPSASPSLSWRHQPKLTEAADADLRRALARAESTSELEEIWRSVEATAWTSVHTLIAGQRKAELIKAAQDG